MGLSSVPEADDGEWGCLGGDWECLNGGTEKIGKYHLVLEENTTFFSSSDNINKKDQLCW